MSQRGGGGGVQLLCIHRYRPKHNFFVVVFFIWNIFVLILILVQLFLQTKGLLFKNILSISSTEKYFFNSSCEEIGIEQMDTVNRVIRVGKFAASKISSAHMRSNNQYLLETLPQK